jgi:hypothetical protein
VKHLLFKPGFPVATFPAFAEAEALPKTFTKIRNKEAFHSGLKGWGVCEISDG